MIPKKELKDDLRRLPQLDLIELRAFGPTVSEHLPR